MPVTVTTWYPNLQLVFDITPHTRHRYPASESDRGWGVHRIFKRRRHFPLTGNFSKEMHIFDDYLIKAVPEMVKVTYGIREVSIAVQALNPCDVEGVHTRVMGAMFGATLEITK